MMIRLRTGLLILGLTSLSLATLAWWSVADGPETRFLRDLRLVHFSTSMIALPDAEKERAAHQDAKNLSIDLFKAYRRNLESDSRFDLAWMLITNESPEYLAFAQQHVDDVPWAEARIWRFRRQAEGLSIGYREKLLKLILASPTSEAKLAAARWYRKEGRIRECEDAYRAAMRNGLFWDSLDAADQLLESNQYQEEAVDYLLSVVRDSDHFTERAAISLLVHYDALENLRPLADSCGREPKDGPNRQLLVGQLTELIATSK